MSEHYYTQSPKASSDPRDIVVKARGQTLVLRTDAGVFSKSGLDYGTRVLIEATDLAGVANAVDLGCGYGPVTAFLSRAFPHVRWLMIDVNERALILARHNTAHLSPFVEFLQSDGFTSVASDRKFDAILLNPPIRAGKTTVYRLFEECAGRLTLDGALWVVIHKKQGAESAQEHLKSLFATVDRVTRDAGYNVFRCTERRLS